MCLNIHLRDLPLNAQFGQTRHLSTQLRSGEKDWPSASVVNWPYYPAAWFQSQLSVMVSANHFRTCHATLHKWGPAKSRTCNCGQQQPYCGCMCSLIKFDGGLQLLHEVEDDAVKWLESMATTAFAKWNKLCVEDATMLKYPQNPNQFHKIHNDTQTDKYRHSNRHSPQLKLLISPFSRQLMKITEFNHWPPSRQCCVHWRLHLQPAAAALHSMH